MKSALRLSALVLALAACSSKPPDPQLQFATVGFVLQLPAGMQQALDAVAPGFKSVRTDSFRSDVSQAAALSGGGLQAMFATIGDFDGDGTQDVAVEGAVPGDSALHVIAIMNGKKPWAVEVARYPVYDADAVGVYVSKPTAGHPGSFEVVNYPDSSMVYAYKSGGFVGTAFQSH
ncbi:MAG: hypothetical protein WBQ26_14425 [Gemmatimonadaceae bacterium]|nr:hypothetical protein [Gemmatimonadaceae bacterium]